MHSSSKLTCSASTSATLRARFMTGSGRRAASPGQPTAQTVHIPETGTPVTGLPLDRNPPTQPAPQHDSTGRGEAPLAFDVCKALRDPVTADAHDVDPADMAVSPVITPQDEHPVTGRHHLLDVEADVRRSRDDLIPRFEHSLAARQAATVRRSRVLEYAVVSDQ